MVFDFFLNLGLVLVTMIGRFIGILYHSLPVNIRLMVQLHAILSELT